MLRCTAQEFERRLDGGTVVPGLKSDPTESRPWAESSWAVSQARKARLSGFWEGSEAHFQYEYGVVRVYHVYIIHNVWHAGALKQIKPEQLQLWLKPIELIGTVSDNDFVLFPRIIRGTGNIPKSCTSQIATTGMHTAISWGSRRYPDQAVVLRIGHGAASLHVPRRVHVRECSLTRRNSARARSQTHPLPRRCRWVSAHMLVLYSNAKRGVMIRGEVMFHVRLEFTVS